MATKKKPGRAVPATAATQAAAPVTHLSDIDRARYAEAHYRAEAAVGKVRDASRDFQDAQKANAEATQKYVALQGELVAAYGLTTEDRVVVETGEILRPMKPAPATKPA